MDGVYRPVDAVGEQSLSAAFAAPLAMILVLPCLVLTQAGHHRPAQVEEAAPALSLGHVNRGDDPHIGDLQNTPPSSVGPLAHVAAKL